MKICNLFFLLLVTFKSFAAPQGQLFPLAAITGLQNQSLSFAALDKQLATLEKEKLDFEKSLPQVQEVNSAAAQIKALKQKLEGLTPKETEIINKKISLVTQDYQVLTEIESIRQHYKSTIDEHIRLLTEYKSDPDFKKLQIPDKASYGFEEFEDLGYRLLSLKMRITELEKSRVAAYEDAAKRKKARSIIDEEYQEKSRQQDEFVHGGRAEDIDRQGQAEIIDLQKKLLNDKKILTEARLKEVEQRINFLDSQIIIYRLQLSTLKTDYDKVKRALHVDIDYLSKAETEYANKLNESTVLREKLRSEIKPLLHLKSEIRKRSDEMAGKLNLPASDLVSFREWDKTPQNPKEWRALCALGYAALEESVVDLDREYKEAKIELEKAKMRREDIHVSIIRSWSSLTRRRLGFSSRALEAQIKSYETPKTEIQSDLIQLTDKRNRAISLLQDLNVTLERIKKLTASLKEQQVDAKDSPEIYRGCSNRMNDAEEQIRRRMYLTAKLIEVYSTAISMLEDTIKRIDNVIVELGTKSFWSRSALSIAWPELKNFFPDINRFFEDVYSGFSSYIQTLSIKKFFNWFGDYKTPTHFLLLILRALIVVLLYWILRTYLPDLQSYLARKPSYYVRSSIRLFVVVVLGFINKHLLGLYLWTLIYVLVSMELIGNAYFSLVFYLLSIPYMLYLIHTFINHVTKANESLNYPFVSKSYEGRLMLVVPALFYITIILFFFRQAFLIGNYPSSAVPSILLAINYIVLQFALMSLISKDWILSLIPRTTPLWEWVYDRVDQYYYLLWGLLIAVIIMSNPYVGYGRQVLYVISRLALLGISFPVISYIYNKIRRFSADLFFYYGEGDTVVERFSSARTWYGFFAVAMFCGFVLFGIFLVTRVLGYDFGFRDIFQVLQYELYGGVDEMGRRRSVTAVTFFKLMLFFIGGLFTSYVVNRVVLRRIFDPLLVSSGIQNTVFTFVRYAIIIVALLLGFKAVGLQSFAMQMVFLLGALSFAVKDPLLDFFSYFIILVQRPIKIGDLIKLDEETMGVVRHITPRSVILRRKNSVTLIVPNSQIITRAVTNWNYSPTFFGLHDIFLTVPYSSDPDNVRAAILKVLDNNNNILKTPAPMVLLHDFLDNGYQFMIRGFLTADKVLDQWEISSALRLDIVRALREIGTRVATPTRILKVVNENMPKISEEDI